VIYKLPNGYRVRTTRVDNGIEFETRNAGQATISTVRHTYAEAVPLIRRLSMLDACRFGREFAANAR
jgi:hypothetical protein